MHIKSTEPTPPLTADNNVISWINNYQYLGVWIDSQMKCTTHIAALKERATTRLNAMRCITGAEGGANFNVLRTFYTQAIRSIFDYATPLLIMTTPAQSEALEKAQNEALRIILGAPRWTKTCNLRAEAHLPPVRRRMQALHITILHINFNKGRNMHLLRSIQQCLKQDPALFTKRTWARCAAAGITDTSLQEFFNNHVQDLPHPDYHSKPPWAPPSYTATISSLTKKKSSLSAEELAAQARNALASVPEEGSAVYFTDGSVDPESGRAAAAFVTSEETAFF
ncbi:hypothetical protein E2C01_081473 [Portunus trituberculatus]|uniref:RNA-directed DNA polymerase from mobile element jockey n=1 Tax=Portunus trituberculatus TaxID=210409 RepID=A0A5B7J190_PORTR|nr:hypothetical protein [Portunus trituberculatus]